MNRPDRILVRGTNWLGDAVMTAPALLRLRERFPGAHIALLTPEKLLALWLNHPGIDELISFPPDESVFSVAKKLRAGKFDAALVLPNSPRSAIEVYLAGIPRRTGYARPWRNLFLTYVVPPRQGAMKMRKRSPAEIRELVGLPQNVTQNSKPITQNSSRHQINEYLNLAAAWGADPAPTPPKLFVGADELDAAKKKFGLENISNPIFGLNPGAEYGPAKRWPIGRFIAVAKEIQRRTNCVWILFGAGNDVELANQIEAAMSSRDAVFNLAGKTSLRELMSLLKLCRVFLTNDTGPMHLAAALGIRVVAIFGSTSPELTGPVSADGLRHAILASDAPCSPCFLRECPIDFRCMNGIEVERVVEAVGK